MRQPPPSVCLCVCVSVCLCVCVSFCSFRPKLAHFDADANVLLIRSKLNSARNADSPIICGVLHCASLQTASVAKPFRSAVTAALHISIESGNCIDPQRQRASYNLLLGCTQVLHFPSSSPHTLPNTHAQTHTTSHAISHSPSLLPHPHSPPQQTTTKVHSEVRSHAWIAQVLLCACCQVRCICSKSNIFPTGCPGVCYPFPCFSDLCARVTKVRENLQPPSLSEEGHHCAKRKKKLLGKQAAH